MNEQTNPKPLDEETVDSESSEGTQEQITDREASGTAEEEVETVTGENQEAVAVDSTPTEPAAHSAAGTKEADTPPTLQELDALENEYSEDEFEMLSKLYEDTLVDFNSGQIVIGKVLAIHNNEVSIDIGFKSEGTVPIEEFEDPSDIMVGDNVEVLIDEIEDADGFLVLSKRKADFLRIWEQVIKSYEKGDVLRGKCTRRIKGGIVVDLGGVDAFLPGSQIDVRPIRDFDALIGKDMDFKIVKVNHLRKNIVVSHRVLVEQEMKGQREKILEELERGQILEGTVKNITDFGVFIDLGGVDGLLHINDLSWGRVSHPSEVVALDEKIKVVVLDYNERKDRISLGLKQLQAHPWENVEEKYPVASLVRGKVVSISDYGAFVELEKGVEGLIHISEMSWTQHIKHPSKILTVGEMVEAKVLSIQKEERKISLGLKQLEPDPWETLLERYPVGSRHAGKVRNLTNFGAFVELEDGIDGLIHISDLSWTKKIRHPGEVVKKGEDIEVVVLNVDRDNRRISLGYKQTQDNPWDFFEDRYKPGTQIEGKVVRLIEKGLLAELPEGVDGFVPMSQLAKEKIAKPADGYQIDDLLNLTVIEFNKNSKKIVLSETAAPKIEEKKAGADSAKAKGATVEAEKAGAEVETAEHREAEKQEVAEAVKIEQMESETAEAVETGTIEQEEVETVAEKSTAESVETSSEEEIPETEPAKTSKEEEGSAAPEEEESTSTDEADTAEKTDGEK